MVTTGDASFKAHTGTVGTSAAKVYVELGGLLNVEAGGIDSGASAYFIGTSSDNTAHLLADWATPGTVTFEGRTVPPSGPSYTLQNQRQAESQTNSRTANEQPSFGPLGLGYWGGSMLQQPDVFGQDL